MTRYIPPDKRKTIAERAHFRCEYCQIHERHSFLAFHVEHIISIKHGGKSDLQNLAYSCAICNFNKGTDIGTWVASDEKKLVRFFNPRIDNWEEHFEIESTGLIIGKTDIANATIKILKLNHPESIIERRLMIEMKIW